jgi:hypothetical protein
VHKNAESYASTQWLVMYTYLDVSAWSLSDEFYYNMDNFKFRLKYRAIIPICFNEVTEDSRITTHLYRAFHNVLHDYKHL